MRKKSFQEIYQKAPATQKERLANFRKNHPYKTLEVNKIQWEYLRYGNGEKNLLFLTGGTRIGESYILYPHLEKKFKVISPSYPFLTKVEDFIEGIAKIIEKEGITETYLLGTSLGGIFGQEFVRRYPKKIKKVIIANTMPPSPFYNSRSKNVVRLLALLPKWFIRYLTKRNLLNMWGEVAESEKDFWEAYIDDLASNHMPKVWIKSQFKLSYDFSNNYIYTPQDLLNWSGEMMIINSENDTTFDGTIQKRLIALYPKAKVHTIKEAGHVPVLKKRKEYLNTIFSFFDVEKTFEEI